jgi:Ran-binding protein 1
MRDEKTLKIRANHLIMSTSIEEHSGNEKALVFACVDFAEEVMTPELFCIRFASADRANEFKTAYEEAAKTNEPLLAESKEAPEGDIKEKVLVAEVAEEEVNKVAEDIKNL